jgi:hypothetical protein
VDLLSDSVHAHISELNICIPETEVDDADRIGEDADEHFKTDVERHREDLARLTKSEKSAVVKKKPTVVASEPPVVKSSTPLSVINQSVIHCLVPNASLSPLANDSKQPSLLRDPSSLLLALY